MIDISDGLSTDLSHILEESRCGALSQVAQLPIAHCLRELSQADLTLKASDIALHSGEEYELLFTAREENQRQIAELATSLNIAVTVIGQITEGSEALLEDEGETRQLEPSGYEHNL